ncbi:MAG TPA: DUF4783 domain-containing protein [Bacteroidetes bacterium]|nr:DUF4783 domain-containing protein [Bacteroidota bacterium]
MRKVSKPIIFFLVILFPIFRTEESHARASIPDGIIKSIRKGDADGLAAYFNTSVQLVILEKGNIYSRSQASMIMKDFFRKNHPRSFAIIHQGGKGNAHYGIGIMKTDKQNYRIYLLIKPANKKSYIHQLRIEKENG